MFKNEKSLEKRIRELINEHVARESEILVLEYKTISDIIICRQGHSPGIFFIEVKHYKQYERIGIGNQKGEGIQPEILKKRPEYPESNLRWLIGQFHEGETKYWFVPSGIVSNYIMGRGIERNKQNNIQEALIRETPSISEDELITELNNWLSSYQGH